MSRYMNLTVVEVRGPDKILARETPGPTASAETVEYALFFKEMNSYFNNGVLTFEIHFPKPNEICVAQNSQNNRWHRVRVEEILTTLNGPKANCFFLDTGEKQLIQVLKIQKIPKRFLTVPFQVKVFALYGLKPLSMVVDPTLTVSQIPCKKWDSSAAVHIKKLINCASVIQAVIKLRGEEGELLAMIYLTFSSNGEILSLNEELINKGYAIKDPVINKSFGEETKNFVQNVFQTNGSLSLKAEQHDHPTPKFDSLQSLNEFYRRSKTNNSPVPVRVSSRSDIPQINSSDDFGNLSSISSSSSRNSSFLHPLGQNSFSNSEECRKIPCKSSSPNPPSEISVDQPTTDTGALDKLLSYHKKFQQNNPIIKESDSLKPSVSYQMPKLERANTFPAAESPSCNPDMPVSSIESDSSSTSEESEMSYDSEEKENNAISPSVISTNPNSKTIFKVSPVKRLSPDVSSTLTTGNLTNFLAYHKKLVNSNQDTVPTGSAFKILDHSSNISATKVQLTVADGKIIQSSNDFPVSNSVQIQAQNKHPNTHPHDHQSVLKIGSCKSLKPLINQSSFTHQHSLTDSDYLDKSRCHETKPDLPFRRIQPKYDTRLNCDQIKQSHHIPVFFESASTNSKNIIEKQTNMPFSRIQPEDNDRPISDISLHYDQVKKSQNIPVFFESASTNSRDDMEKQTNLPFSRIQPEDDDRPISAMSLYCDQLKRKSQNVAAFLELDSTNSENGKPKFFPSSENLSSTNNSTISNKGNVIVNKIPHIKEEETANRLNPDSTHLTGDRCNNIKDISSENEKCKIFQSNSKETTFPSSHTSLTTSAVTMLNFSVSSKLLSSSPANTIRMLQGLNTLPLNKLNACENGNSSGSGFSKKFQTFTDIDDSDLSEIEMDNASKSQTENDSREILKNQRRNAALSDNSKPLIQSQEFSNSECLPGFCDLSPVPVPPLNPEEETHIFGFQSEIRSVQQDATSRKADSIFNDDKMEIHSLHKIENLPEIVTTTPNLKQDFSSTADIESTPSEIERLRNENEKAGKAESLELVTNESHNATSLRVSTSTNIAGKMPTMVANSTNCCKNAPTNIEACQGKLKVNIPPPLNASENEDKIFSVKTTARNSSNQIISRCSSEKVGVFKTNESENKKYNPFLKYFEQSHGNDDYFSSVKFVSDSDFDIQSISTNLSSAANNKKEAGCANLSSAVVNEEIVETSAMTSAKGNAAVSIIDWSYAGNDEEMESENKEIPSLTVMSAAVNYKEMALGLSLSSEVDNAELLGLTDVSREMDDTEIPPSTVMSSKVNNSEIELVLGFLSEVDNTVILGSTGVSSEANNTEILGSTGVSSEANNTEILGSTGVPSEVNNTEILGSTGVSSEANNTEILGSTGVPSEVNNKEILGSTAVSSEANNTEILGSTGVPSEVNNTEILGSTDFFSEVDNTEILKPTSVASDIDNTEILGSTGVSSEVENTEILGSTGVSSEVENTEILGSTGVSSEVENTEILGSTGVSSEVENTEILGSTGVSSEVENTEILGSTGVSSEVENTEILESTGVSSEVENTEIVAALCLSSEVDNTDIFGSNCVSSEADNTEILGSTCVSSEANNTEILESTGVAYVVDNTEILRFTGLFSEVNNTEISRSTGVSSEVNNTEILGSTGIFSEVNNTEILGSTGFFSEGNNTEILGSTDFFSEVDNTEILKPTSVASDIYNTEILRSTGVSSEVNNTEILGSTGFFSEVDNTEKLKPTSVASDIVNTEILGSTGASAEVENTEIVAAICLSSEVDNTDIFGFNCVSSEVDNTEILKSTGVTTDMDNIEILRSTGIISEVDNIEILGYNGVSSEVDNTEILRLTGVFSEVNNTEILGSTPVSSEVENTEIAGSTGVSSEVDNTEILKSTAVSSELDNTYIFGFNCVSSEVDNTEILRSTGVVSEVDNIEILGYNGVSSEVDNTEILRSTGVFSEVNNTEILGSTGVSSEVDNAEILGSTGVSSELDDTEILGSTGVSSELDNTEISGSTGVSSELDNIEILGSTGVSSELDNTEISGSTGVSSELDNIEILGSTGVSSELDNIEILGSTGVSSELDNIEILGSTGVSSELDDTEILGSTGVSSELDNTEILGSTGVSSELDNTEILGSTGVSSELDNTEILGSTGVSPELDNTEILGSTGVSSELDNTEILGSTGVSSERDNTEILGSTGVSSERDNTEILGSTGVSSEVNNTEILGFTGLSYEVDNTKLELTGLSSKVDNTEIAITGLSSEVDNTQISLSTGALSEIDNKKIVASTGVSLEVDNTDTSSSSGKEISAFSVISSAVDCDGAVECDVYNPGSAYDEVISSPELSFIENKDISSSMSVDIENVLTSYKNNIEPPSLIKELVPLNESMDSFSKTDNENILRVEDNMKSIRDACLLAMPALIAISTDDSNSEFLSSSENEDSLSESSSVGCPDDTGESVDSSVKDLPDNKIDFSSSLQTIINANYKMPSLSSINDETEGFYSVTPGLDCNPVLHSPLSAPDDPQPVLPSVNDISGVMFPELSDCVSLSYPVRNELDNTIPVEQCVGIDSCKNNDLGATHTILNSQERQLISASTTDENTQAVSPLNNLPHLPRQVDMKPNPNPVVSFSPTPVPLEQMIKAKDHSSNSVVKSLNVRDHTMDCIRGRRILEKLGVTKKANMTQKNDGQSATTESILLNDLVLFVAETIPNPIYNLQEFDVPEALSQLTENLNINPTPIQAYSWGPALRGKNIIGISPLGSGKTWAYIVPILAFLCQYNIYSDIKFSNGPFVLILVSTWTKAISVYKQCKHISQSNREIIVEIIYGGGEESKKSVNLLNGCHILVATLPCFKRMFDSKFTSLDRLCHLVIDDADILLQDFYKEIVDLMCKYKNLVESRDKGYQRHQVMAYSSKWTSYIKGFVKNAIRDPVIIITDMMEAAIYGGVKQIPIMCEESDQKDQLVKLVPQILKKGEKVIVFTLDDDCFELQNLLIQHLQIPVAVACNSFYKSELKIVSAEWKLPLSENEPYRLLVSSDTALCDLLINDATCVVHYRMPKKKIHIGLRIQTMSNYYQHYQDDQPPAKIVKSYILMLPENKRQVKSLRSFLMRSINITNKETWDFLSNIRQNEDFNPEIKLCLNLKAFGKCRNKYQCNDRHCVVPSVDLNGTSSQHICLPTQGDVRVKILHVKTTNNFYVRILEHKNGLYKSIQNHTDLASLIMEMAFYYNNHSNRLVLDELKVGTLCVVNISEQFSRVKVVQPYDNASKNTASLFFVDIGKLESHPICNLYQLADEFKTIPFQAIEVFLCCLRPVDFDTEWTPASNSFAESWLESKIFYGKIRFVMNNTLWLDPLLRRTFLKAIKTVTNGPSLRRELINNNLAVDNPQHLILLHQLFEGYVPKLIPLNNRQSSCSSWEFLLENETLQTPADDYEDVVISYIFNPEHFYVQKMDMKICFNDLMMKIEEKMNLETEPQQKRDWLVGMHCLSKSLLDSRWYRVIILTLLDSNAVVHFVDYGNIEEVPIDELRTIPRELMYLPSQAIECKLAHIKPFEDQWSAKCNDMMYYMTQTVDNVYKTLALRVVSEIPTDGKLPQYCVTLLDTSYERVMNIGQELVWWKMAAPNDDHYQTLFPEQQTQQMFYPSAGKIADMCAILYSEQTSSLQYDKLMTSYIKVCLRHPEKLVEENVPECLLKLFTYTHNTEMFSSVLEYIKLLMAKPSLYGNLLSCGILQNLGQILKMQDDESVLRKTFQLIQFMIKIDSTLIMKITSLKSGLFSIMCEILKSFYANEIKISACQLLESFCLVDKKCSENLIQLQVCPILLPDVLEMQDHDFTEAYLSLLDPLSQLNSGLIAIKREKPMEEIMKIIEAAKCEKCVSKCLFALKRLSDQNRKNKTLLLELNAVAIFSSCQNLLNGTEAATLCQELLDGLVVKVHYNKGDNRVSICSQLQPTNERNFSVLWCQNKFRVLITVKVTKSEWSDCKFQKTSLHFSLISNDGIKQSVNYELFDEVIVEKCAVCLQNKETIISLCKTEVGYWPHLLQDKFNKPSNLHVDFDKIESDDSDSEEVEADEKNPFTLQVVLKEPLIKLVRKKLSSDEEEEVPLPVDPAESDDDSLVNSDFEEYDRFNIFNTK